MTSASTEQSGKMPTLLEVFGPFEIGCTKLRNNSRQIENMHIQSFWTTEASAYSQKRGCYVFALRAGRGSMPWYVGKTTRSFKQECFSPHKLRKYNKALNKRKRGIPVIFFVARGGANNHVPKKDTRELERLLIQNALAANQDLTNVANAKNLPKWGIKGVIRGGKGKPDSTAAAFAKMMGF